LVRSISLLGAISIVVGAVIGAGIYIMVGAIASKAGSALWFAFLVAMLVSLLGVIPLVQLSAALPRAGGGYLYTSRMFGPLAGVIVSNMVILAGSSSTVLVCLTLSKSVAPLLPFAIDDHLGGMVIFALFLVVYQFGVALAMSLQVIMAAQMIIALLIYTVAGLITTPVTVGLSPPLGTGPFVEAILLCYTCCMGFQVIAELGEEIKDARRNIPLALFVGGGIVAAIYVGIGLIFVSSVGYDAGGYKHLQVPLTDSARTFLSPSFVWFIALGAVTAGLTSLNAGAIALPRELFAQARDGIAPSWLGTIHLRTHTPQHAVSAFALVVLLLLATWRDADFYSLIAGVGIMVMSAVLCIAALRLPKRLPARYATASIKFPPVIIGACATFTVVVSAVLILFMAFERPSVIAVYVVWAGISAGYFYAQTRRFAPEDWERLRDIPGEDETA